MSNFNGGYIKASQEAYNLLVEGGYSARDSYGVLDQCYRFEDEKFLACGLGWCKDFSKLKQFYINNGELSWDEPKELILGSETLKIKDEDGKVYEFEKPNNFLAELLKVIGSSYIVGLRNEVQMIRWDIHGVCVVTTQGARLVEHASKYNLTPIKPKWYEDESNFPCLIVSETNDWLGIKSKERFLYFTEDSTSKWKLATKQEVESLYYEGK